jgi:hypothetical protein
MAILKVEKVGGLAGFGGSHLRSCGEVDSDLLSPEDKKAVEGLFRSAGHPSSNTRDGFRFRISRSTTSGNETIEVPEQLVPPAVAGSVRDVLI